MLRPYKGDVLIVVGMTVAPLPVVAVDSVVLALVATIAPVLDYEVAPISAVFAVVPVVVVAVVAIVDADLDASFLRLGAGDEDGRRGKSSTQKQQTEVSIDMTQDDFLRVRETQLQNPGRDDYALLARWCMYRTTRF
jgi:hypothetical protein